MAKQQGLTFESWRSTFHQNVKDDPTAERAWSDIDSAGISAAAEQLLHQFAYAGGAMNRQNLRQLKRLAGLIRKVETAVQKAETMKSRANAELYQRHAREWVAQLMNEQWIAEPNTPTRTFRQAMMSHTALRISPLGRLARNFAKASEGARREKGKNYLKVLKDYASEHGVTLGFERISALAYCSDPSQVGDCAYFQRSFIRWEKQPEVELDCKELLIRFKQTPLPSAAAVPQS